MQNETLQSAVEKLTMQNETLQKIVGSAPEEAFNSVRAYVESVLNPNRPTLKLPDWIEDYAAENAKLGAYIRNEIQVLDIKGINDIGRKETVVSDIKLLIERGEYNDAIKSLESFLLVMQAELAAFGARIALRAVSGNVVEMNSALSEVCEAISNYKENEESK